MRQRAEVFPRLAVRHLFERRAPVPGPLCRPRHIDGSVQAFLASSGAVADCVLAVDCRAGRRRFRASRGGGGGRCPICARCSCRGAKNFGGGCRSRSGANIFGGGGRSRSGAKIFDGGGRVLERACVLTRELAGLVLGQHVVHHPALSLDAVTDRRFVFLACTGPSFHILAFKKFKLCARHLRAVHVNNHHMADLVVEAVPSGDLERSYHGPSFLQTLYCGVDTLGSLQNPRITWVGPPIFGRIVVALRVGTVYSLVDVQADTLGTTRNNSNTIPGGNQLLTPALATTATQHRVALNC